MKKTALLLAGLLLFLLTGCASSGGDWTAAALARPDPGSDGTVDLNGFAVAISVNASFGGLELRCKSEGTDNGVTVSVYRADRSYEVSLSASPARSCTLKNVGNDFLWKFRTLPAGDYLIVFSDARQVSGVFSVVPSDEANGKILQYRDGAAVTDGTCALTLLLSTQKKDGFTYLDRFAYPVPDQGDGTQS